MQVNLVMDFISSACVVYNYNQWMLGSHSVRGMSTLSSERLNLARKDHGVVARAVISRTFLNGTSRFNHRSK